MNNKNNDNKTDIDPFIELNININNDLELKDLEPVDFSELFDLKD